MAESNLGLRFQVRGVVAEKRQYTGKDGKPAHAMEIAFVGGSLGIFGQKGSELFESCPAQGEECVVAGRCKPAGVDRNSRPVFSLEAEQLGAPRRA